MKTRSSDELKEIILSTNDVKEAMAELARERAKQYEGRLQVKPAEDKIYGEIQKEASGVIDRIVSTYNHGVLKWMAQIMKKTFINIYEKIIVNESSLSKLRKMCEQRKGPIIFCPTHRSYIDFLLVSLILYYYKMEVPHICAGEDFLNIVVVN